MLFSNYAPESQMFNKGVNFEGTLFDKIALAMNGYKTTGERNTFGKINDIATPIIGGIGGAGLSVLTGGSMADGYKSGSQFGTGLLSFQKSLVDEGFMGTNQSGMAIEDMQKAQSNAAISSELISSILGIADPAVKATLGAVTGGASTIGGSMKSMFFDGGMVDKIFSPASIDSVFENYDSVLDFLPESLKPKELNTESSYVVPRGDFGLTDAVLGVEPKSVLGKNADISQMIAQAENPTDKNLNAPHIYKRRNSVGPGHFGKYQFEKSFVDKYYGGTVEEFLADPVGQERAFNARLTDLNTEALTLIRKTGSNIDFDKARLLVHFKGLGGATKALKSNDLDTKTKVNPSINGYFDRASGKLLNFNGGLISPEYGLFGGETQRKTVISKEVDGVNISFDASNEPYTIYSPNNYSEDLYLIDKERAKEMGIEQMLDRLSIGQMRYGEYILPQESALLMKSLVNDKKLSDETKKDLIGSLVFDTVRWKLEEYDFDEDEDMYAGGGQPKPKSKKTINEKIKYISENIQKLGLEENAESIRINIQKYIEDGNEKKIDEIVDSINPKSRANTFFDLKMRGFLGESESSGTGIGFLDNLAVKAIDKIRGVKNDSFSSSSKSIQNSGKLSRNLNSAGVYDFMGTPLAKPTDQNIFSDLNSTPLPKDGKSLSMGSPDIYPDQKNTPVSSTRKSNTKSKKFSTIFENSGDSSFQDVKTFQEQYNSEISSKYGVPKIKIDGLLGEETLRAIQNASGFGIPSTIKTLEYIDTVSGEKKALLSGIDYGKLSKISGIDPIDGRINLPGSVAESKTGSLADRVSGIPDSLSTTGKGNDVISTLSGQKANITDGIMDLGSMLTGLSLANTDIPEFSESDLYLKSRKNAVDLMNTGFSAEIVSDFSKQNQNQLATNIAAIDATGGTQGQVLAALSNAFGNQDEILSSFASQNQNAIMANNAAVSSFANYDQNRLDSQTSMNRAIAMDARDTGAAIVGATLQNRENRNQFNSEFGPGSIYEQIAIAQKESLDEEKKTQQAIQKSLKLITNQ